MIISLMENKLKWALAQDSKHQTEAELSDEDFSPLLCQWVEKKRQKV